MERNAMDGLYENLLRSIADPFFIIGEDGTYLDVFGGTERSLYDDARSLKGRNIHDFMEPSFAAFFMEQVRRSLEGSRLHIFEYQLETEKVDGIPRVGPGGLQWFEARLRSLDEPVEGQRAVTALVLNITERKQMQQRLRDLSCQDSLTQVANRRYFFERFSDQLDLFIQDKVPLAVLIIDIDRFKTINDTYGHFAGDHVLCVLAKLLRTLLREKDLLARFGGDEFIISVEGRPLEAVIDLAEEIREQTHHHLFTFGETRISLSVSIGVSIVSIFDTDTTGIVKRADKALYLAKEGGRNRVERL